MTRKHLSFLTATAVVVVCTALTVGIATATAGGGNSANAKLCQKNGWQTLVTATGDTFQSVDECTSYAARGGVLHPLSSAPCLDGGWQANVFALGETTCRNQPLAGAQRSGFEGLAQGICNLNITWQYGFCIG